MIAITVIAYLWFSVIVSMLFGRAARLGGNAHE